MTPSIEPADDDRAVRTADEAAEWDERYSAEADGGAMWSGRPNGTLVAEVADLRPGTALDVGCGEGADAIWLARRGWRVTALEPSRVALDRARASAEDAGVDVRWIHAGLLDVRDELGRHDLVSAQYPALRHEDGDPAVVALLAAVAPGGTLLVVHHDDHDHAGHGHDHAPDDEDADEHGLGAGHGHGHGDGDGQGHEPGEAGFDPDDYVMPDDVRVSLDDRWEVEVDTVRERPGPLPDDARHVRDVVLRARRDV